MAPSCLALGLVLFAWLLPAGLPAQVLKVGDRASLERALTRVRPGGRVVLAPGEYGNGLRILGLRGRRGKAVILEGGDPKHPPRFRGGKVGIHLSGCSWVVLRNLEVRGCSGNGINVDDGGQKEQPSEGMVLENLVIRDIGPVGNRDGLKLSGLKGFQVRGCRIAGWGGSAIDMVGCREGKVQGCEFMGKEGFSQASGVQVKGGSERILVEGNFFKDAGLRAVNLGGSTDLKFFRPKPKNFEARGIEVVGNRFWGSQSPIAFTSSQACVVRENTILFPKRWVFRILQEQEVPPFLPCQGGRFERNLVVFDKGLKAVVNLGPNTLPKTFVFEGNAWFCRGGKRPIQLPSPERKGIYQVDPKLVPLESGWLEMGSKDPRLRKVGAGSFLRRRAQERRKPWKRRGGKRNTGEKR